MNAIYKGSGTDNFTLSYNKRGDMTSDGQFYFTYEYDAFGRLRRISDVEALLAVEYRYNGLGHRIGWHYDVDADAFVEDTNDDPWYFFVYDDQWRIAATYRIKNGPDGTPKEEFIYHNAGLGEPGAASSGGSYIDLVILRDRDMTNGWAGNPDGTLEERTYYCHNWRGDVVALLNNSGQQVQQVRYGEYGDVFGLPRGDTDGDGDVNDGSHTDDTDQIQTWINGGAGAYDVRGDLDLDGDVDSTDKTTALGMANTVLGWGKLSLSLTSSGGGNRKGYAGYEMDSALEASWRIYHVRNRVYNASLGRWLTRDPEEYDDGVSLYQYSVSNPITFVDPSGLGGVRKAYQDHRRISGDLPPIYPPNHTPRLPGNEPECSSSGATKWTSWYEHCIAVAPGTPVPGVRKCFQKWLCVYVNPVGLRWQTTGSIDCELCGFKWPQPQESEPHRPWPPARMRPPFGPELPRYAGFESPNNAVLKLMRWNDHASN